MTLLELGMAMIAAGICVLAFAYNLTLAGYSRKKMLRGVSFEAQIYNRKEISRHIKPIGYSLIVIAVFTIFGVCGLLNTAETVEIIPYKVDVMIAQGKTIVVVDGETHVFDKKYYRIGRIYTVKKINVYGLVINRTIHISGGEMWERINE